MKLKLSSQLQGLVQAVGGPDGLEAILIDFYHEQAHDILVGFFFDGQDLRAIALKQKAFILKAAGLIPVYGGKVPAVAHDDLPPILSGHFDRRLRILENVLRKNKIAESWIKIWIDFESAFRDVIVKKEKRT